MSFPFYFGSYKVKLLFSVFCVFILAMLPIWPVEGLWLGLPVWAVICVLACAACSCWIAYIALFRWQDLEGNDVGD